MGLTHSENRRRPGSRRWLALALLGTAFLMATLDATIVFVAIPPIDRALGFSAGDVQWVMSAYLLTFGGLLLLGGRSADLLGRRRVFTAGATMFGLSSLACGFSWAPEVLIAARVLQGASAAMMAPSALSIVMAIFPEGPERNKALGIWGGIGGIGATAGLLVGGPVAGGLGWEWVFLINVPVAVAMVALSPILLPESRDYGRGRTFDVAGAASVTAALVLLTYALSEAPESGWAAADTVGAIAAAAALLALFTLIESRSPAPLVPLRALRSRTLLGGNLVLLLAGMAIDGTFLILTLYAQDVLGYSTLQFGLMAATMTVISVAATYAAQSLVTRFGPKPIAVIGMLLVGAGCLLLTGVSVDGSYRDDLLLGLLLFGSGLGAAFVAAQITALTGVAEAESGLAAGLAETSFGIGGALGLAILSSVAVARADAVLGGAGGTERLLAMTEGIQAAFAVVVGLAAVGVVLAATLVGRQRVGIAVRAGGESGC